MTATMQIEIDGIKLEIEFSKERAEMISKLLELHDKISRDLTGFEDGEADSDKAQAGSERIVRRYQI